MTIEEAIIQFKEDADSNRADLDMEWAEENEQVAKWLEELKAIKEGVVFYSNRPIEDIVLEARADAIPEGMMLVKKDDFTEDLLNQGYTKGRLDTVNEFLPILKELIKEHRNKIDRIDGIITEQLDKSDNQVECQTLRWVLDVISDVTEYTLVSKILKKQINERVEQNDN